MALSRNPVLAAICIVFFVFAFFQLLTGKYLGKTRSVLPPEFEAKRVTIAARHNQIVGVMVLLLLAAILSIAVVLRDSPRMWTFLAIAVLGLAEFFAIKRLLKYDEQLCVRFGFLCPHCHKPLYEARSFISLNGVCPKCRRSILPAAQHSAVLS